MSRYTIELRYLIEGNYDLGLKDYPIFDESYREQLNNKIIQVALKKLTQRQQEMVRLLYWEGKSQKDLCEIYGISKQAISNALDRIHNTLKKFLKEN